MPKNFKKAYGCRKMFVYRALWIHRGLNSYDIARRFGVKRSSVMRAIDRAFAEMNLENNWVDEYQRAQQVSHIYAH